MVVILLVTLFCIALVITLMGLYLSARSQTSRTRDIAYAPRAFLVSSSGSRKDISRRFSRGKVYIPDPHESRGNALGRWPRWLVIIVGATIVFVLCLLLFVQMMSYN